MLRRALRAYDEGALATAERLFTAVLQAQPDNFDALHGLGLIHYRRGRLDAALALIQAALQSDLDRADGFASLGLVFHALKQFERALIAEALEQTGGSVAVAADRLQLGKATLYEKIKRYGLAARGEGER